MAHIITPQSFGQMYEPAVARMDRRAAGIEKPIPFPNAWPQLTEQMDGGWWPGVYVLVGNTGSGKSQFALQAGIAAAQKGIPVLYIGLELDREQCIARIGGMLTGQAWATIYLGLDQGVALEKMKRSPLVQAFREAPFEFAMSPSGDFPFEALLPLIERTRAIHPDTADKLRPMFVIVDYLQLIDSLDAKMELRERMKKAAYRANAACHQFNAVCLLLSSTSRDTYGLLDDRGRSSSQSNMLRPGEGPAARLVGVGKESGDIEYASSNMLVLTYNDGSNIAPGPDYDVKEIKNKGYHFLALAKRRTGQSCWVMAQFEPTSMGFRTIQSTFGLTIEKSKKGRKREDNDE